METNEYILIDRSGSMADRWDEALGAVNSYVQNLKKNEQKAILTVATFDNGSYDIIRNKISLKDWKDISNADATPRGLTPLLDSLAKAIADAEAVNAEKTVIIVMTDGAENASKEVKKETVKASIERIQKKNWQIVFLGADFDAFDEAGGLGVPRSSVLIMKSGSYRAGINGLYKARTSFASSGSAVDFSEEDRAKAKGEQYGRYKGDAE